MIIPSKFIPIEKSILKSSAVILSKFHDEISLLKLYEIQMDEFDSIDEFIISIVVLWVLGKIEVDFESEVIKHVG